MLDTLTPQNRDDFSQRYKNSFGFLIQDKTRTLVYIKSVARDKVVFENLDGMEFFAISGQNVQFEFLPITRGWFETSVGPVLLQRIPAKQYCRGISESNTSVAVLSGKTITRGELNIQLLHDIFAETQKKNQLEAYMLRLSHWYILSRFFLINKNVLYFYSVPIGVVSGLTEIVLDNNLVFQEITDIIRRNNLPFKVTVKV